MIFSRVIFLRKEENAALFLMPFALPRVRCALNDCSLAIKSRVSSSMFRASLIMSSSGSSPTHKTLVLSWENDPMLLSRAEIFLTLMR